MPVALYMDHHVHRAITVQLRKRGVDVLTAFEDGRNQLPDDQLLLRAKQLNRVLFTRDIGFKTLAEDWQRQCRSFDGLVFAHPLRGSIGALVKDLELIAKATDPKDWENVVDQIPY
jgi:hypothetical protein